MLGFEDFEGDKGDNMETMGSFRLSYTAWSVLGNASIWIPAPILSD
jgi:hypothetical protein